MKTALILEGGGMKSLYTAGVLDVLMENNIETDIAVGVSAGALFGINYKSKQIGRVLRYNLDYPATSETLGFKSLIKTGNLMNKDFYFYELPYKLDVMDADTYHSCKTRFFAVVTNLETGLAEYKEIDNLFNDDCVEYLRASGSLPFLSKPVYINGVPYLDGGVADSIPVKYFIEKGYDKIITVLTKTVDFRPQMKIPFTKIAYKKYPEFAKVLKYRNPYYSEQCDYIDKLEKENKILVIRPTQNLKVGTIEKNKDRIQELYNLGVSDCKEKLEDIKKYLGY